MTKADKSSWIFNLIFYSFSLVKTFLFKAALFFVVSSCFKSKVLAVRYIEAMTGLTIWYLCFITRLVLLAPLEHFRSEIIIFGIREATLNILSIRRRKSLSPS